MGDAVALRDRSVIDARPMSSAENSCTASGRRHLPSTKTHFSVFDGIEMSSSISDRVKTSFNVANDCAARLGSPSGMNNGWRASGNRIAKLEREMSDVGSA